MPRTDDALWFVFSRGRLVLRVCDGRLAVPDAQPPLLDGVATPPCEVGELGGLRCMACETDEDPGSDEYCTMGLRDSFGVISRPEYRMAGRAWEMLYWDASTKFCSVCGGATAIAGAASKKCTVCGREFFPHVSPAIIVLVRRGDSILMVRAHNFRGSFHGLVAGFVEPGESLEECVVREVREETGLEVDGIRYFGSQPWPYPSCIMLGFVADYVSGEIVLQEEELASAAFFRRDELPELPGKASMARALVDDWLAGF